LNSPFIVFLRIYPIEKSLNGKFPVSLYEQESTCKI
jgi:hypothetical protein